MKLVAGVHIDRVWKFGTPVKSNSVTNLIPILQQKECFSRDFMEKTLGMNTGQAYWHIGQMLKKGIIKKLKKTEYVGNKGKQQALYKVV